MGIEIYCSLEKAQLESMPKKCRVDETDDTDEQCQRAKCKFHEMSATGSSASRHNKTMRNNFGKNNNFFFKAANKQLFNTHNKNAEQTHMHPHHLHFDLRCIMWPNLQGLFVDDERRSLVGQAKRINATWLAYHLVGSKFESNGRFAMLMLSSVSPGRGV